MGHPIFKDAAVTNMPMTYQFDCRATALGVRELMMSLRHVLSDQALAPDVMSNIEIAVAEGLNNIVEHALSGQPLARVEVDLSINARRVFVRLQDPGVAMPGWQLPPGDAVDIAVPKQDLPEGGFGWGLIRSATDRLDYSRINGTNRLQMWFRIHRGS